MSDDLQITIPVNLPDDYSTEQPPKDDAARSACPVQPPKDDAAAAKSQVQPPKDNAACPVSPPNYETEMSDVVLFAKDDDDASFAPVPNIDDGPPSPPKEDASPASTPKKDDSSAPLTMDDIAPPACLSPLPLDETVPWVPRVEPEFSNANGLENADRVQVKHEIEHEIIDLTNDTYFDDDNNDEAIGFDRGLEPDRIVEATEVNGKLMFLIAWKNSKIADLLESTEVYNRCPQLAIQYFEPRRKFCPNEQKK